tara:strand:- start:556 stop:723 length:168 start_codon:yes stop_codon:yes gene_type:complete
MTDLRHEERTSLSGLTEAEAKEFHSYFTTSFLGFLFVAIVAHILCYIFAPWGVNM